MKEGLPASSDEHLPIPMEPLGPIQLVDPFGNPIAVFVFSPSIIPQQSSVTASDDLANKILQGGVSVSELSFHTTGSSALMRIPTGDMVVMTLTLGNLMARSATILVKELRVRSGSLQYMFASCFPLDVCFRFRLMELLQQVGDRYDGTKAVYSCQRMDLHLSS